MFEEALEGRAWLKVGHCGPESLRSGFNFINFLFATFTRADPKSSK